MNELNSSWAFLLGRNDSPGENQRRNFSPSEFMEEYRKLRERFASTHQTADFKELHQLYEKYGISRADQLKYSRINSMLYGGKTVGGIVLGSVPATDLDELLQKGDFAGAVSRLKAGLSPEKLRELVDFPADRRSFDGYELMQWVPALAKSDEHKSSDVLLSYFRMVREGDQYVIRCDKDDFLKFMSDEGYLANFRRDLKDIDRNWFEEVPVPGLDDSVELKQQQHSGMHR